MSQASSCAFEFISYWDLASASGQIILLGEVSGERLNQRCMETLPPFLQSLGEYPRWFVVACLIIVSAVGLWMLIKALKWTLYLLLAVVLLGGGSVVAWLFLR